MLKDIIVVAREKKTADGKKFMIYKCKKADGSYVGLKFRQEVTKRPMQEGRFICTIETEQMNKSLSDFGEVWWVRTDCEDIKPYQHEDTAKDEF